MYYPLNCYKKTRYYYSDNFINDNITYFECRLFNFNDLIEFLSDITWQQYYRYKNGDMFFIDNMGNNISFKHIYELYEYKPKPKKVKYKFRNGPVPKTGKRYSYNWLRSPKTFKECKQNEDFVDFKRNHEYKNKIKGRVRNYLPDSWDDIRRSSNYDKNWKKFRKKQYKAND